MRDGGFVDMGFLFNTEQFFVLDLPPSCPLHPMRGGVYKNNCADVDILFNPNKN